MNINLTEQETRTLKDFLAFHLGDDLANEPPQGEDLETLKNIINKLKIKDDPFSFENVSKVVGKLNETIYGVNPLKENE
jgi:hypothetical protein